MIDEIIPSRHLHVVAAPRVVSGRTRLKEGRPRPTPFGPAGRVASLHVRSRLKLSQAIYPQIDGALTQFTSQRWSLLTAQRFAQLTPRHISKRFLSDYPIGSNILLGISRSVIMDEFKDGMKPPSRGELRSSRLGLWDHRFSSIRRGINFKRGAPSQGNMEE
jgi:hypothetical protein